MRKLLACGDENQTQDLQIWRSEDLQTLDTELLHFLSENNNKTDESPLVRILDHLAETCKTRKAELRPGRKKPGPRQQLANELAWQWKHAFRDAPTAWSALAKDDRDTSPPFVEMLRLVITVVEKRRPRNSVLRPLAERAVKSIVKREKTILSYLQQ